MLGILLALYYVFGTANYLLRRTLALKIGELNRLVNAVFFVFFLLPVGAILALFFPHNLHVGGINILLLLGGSVLWPVYYIVAFSANKHVDAGIFTVINNLSPLFTLAVALPFLKENVSNFQFMGIALLIFSGGLAASAKLRRSNESGWKGILLCFLAAALMGVAVAYEKFMLNRIDFGAYIVYGWGAQLMWAVILAGQELKRLPELLGRNSPVRSTVIVWGASSALRSTMFIIALNISSASLVSAATDFLSVVVVVAAYFYLREREHTTQKWISAIIGIGGLLLLSV